MLQGLTIAIVAVSLVLGHQFGRLGDAIQIVSVLLLAFSLMLTIDQQTKIMRAEQLRDSFTMYWQTYDPVTSDQLDEVVRFPDDYFDIDVYAASYAGKPDRIRRYLRMSKMYEYLAYSSKLHEMRLQDPFGKEWVERWTRDLVLVPEFCDVHRYYASWYPEYSRLVEAQLSSA